MFGNFKKILIGNEDFQLPVPLATQIANGNTDIVFVILYWLNKTNLDIDSILKNKKIHKKILGFLTTVCWFINDMNILLEMLAKNKLFINGEIAFWESKLFKDNLNPNNQNQNWLTILPKPNVLRNLIERKVKETWEIIFAENKEQIALFFNFLGKLNTNRAILLFAQRKYITSRFKQLQWDTLLEDSSCPYDWDHIYPNNWWLYKTPNLNPITRDWRESIGNYRALALEDNRSESDRISPKIRLENSREESFISENNWLIWKQIEGQIEENQAPTLALAIIDRVADIYQEWYDKLFIEDLFENEMIFLK